MKWPKWSISNGSGDFLPLIMGAIVLLYSVPGFIMVLWKPDRNSGVIGVPLLCILGLGIVIGLSFIVLGLRYCSSPGSLLYRLSHGRIFSR